MYKTFLLLVALVTLTYCNAQIQVKNESPVEQSGTGKLWLLDRALPTVPPPPGAASTKSELNSVKLAIGHIGEKEIEAIKFWDAGAPSYQWNLIIRGFIAQNQKVLLRMPAAWMNLAIYDATILALREEAKYKRGRPQSMDPSLTPAIAAHSKYSYPCEHSVTAGAAATVLAYFFPEKKDSILAMAHAAGQSRINAGLQFPSDVEAGWKLGEEVADQIIEKAKNDGSSRVYSGPVNKDPKKWTGAFAMGINLSLFTPLVIRTADQFRPAPPPDFANDMNELKNFKPTFESKYLAYYWAANGDVFNDLASQKMFEYRMMDDALAAARIYTVLSVAFHDMAIAVFDAKYTYWGIRPNQFDSTYKSLITTPPFPGYPSGHAAGAATSAAVLEYFFPADRNQFRKLAQDCADSRFYAGIHFRTDNETALTMGYKIGKYVAETWMKYADFPAANY